MGLFCQPTSYKETIEKLQDAKEAEIAGAYAGLSIPVLDVVLQQLAEALAGIAASATENLFTSSVAELANKAGNEVLGAAVAGLVGVLAIGDEVQNAVRAVLVHNLHRQASLRLIQLQEMQFHSEGILTLLRQYAQPYRNVRDPRLRQAAPYIKNALNKLVKLSNMVDRWSETKPRFSVHLYKSILSDIDRAINSLTATNKSQAARDFSRSVSTKSNLKQLSKSFNDYLWDSVLSEQVVRLETYIWHLTNFLAVVTPTVSRTPNGVGVAQLVKGDNIPGLDPNRANLLRDRKALLETRRKAWRRPVPKAKEPYATMEWIDASKGLLVTHDIALSSASNIVAFTASWSTLTAAADALWLSMAPAEALLSSVNDDVESYLKAAPEAESWTNDFKEAIVTPVSKVPYIAGQLSLVKTMLQAFGKAGENYAAVAADNDKWEEIQAYLAGSAYTKAMDAISVLLGLIPIISLAAFFSPVHVSILRTVTRVFNEADRLLKIAISEEQGLLRLLSEFNIMDNPGTIAAMRNLEVLSKTNPAAAAMVQGLMDGSIANVAQMLVSVGSAATSIMEMFSGCDTVKKDSAKTNMKTSAMVEERNKKVKAQQQADEENRKREAAYEAETKMADAGVPVFYRDPLMFNY